MKARRTQKKIIIPVPTQLELMRRHSAVAQAAHVRGNAAGVHGGSARLRYGTAERRALRQAERNARLSGDHES